MTAQPIPNNHFDRGKPFYPLVINYLVQLIGFKDLATRGLMGSPDLEMQIKQYLGSLQVTDDGYNLREEETKLRKMLGPLQLRSEQYGDHITVDTDMIAQDIVANASYLSASTMKGASSLLILAHELTKDATCHDTAPLWEFLRHCRNAAAHGGQFTLRHPEPRRPAKWGKFEITQSLNGTSLFKIPGTTGLLSPGDPIRLLWDLEQAYPSMS